MTIYIKTSDASKEEIKQLQDYLDKNLWDYWEDNEQKDALVEQEGKDGTS